jgi:hypothetical protein
VAAPQVALLDHPILQGLSRLILLALALDAYRNAVLTRIHAPLNGLQNRVYPIFLDPGLMGRSEQRYQKFRRTSLLSIISIIYVIGNSWVSSHFHRNFGRPSSPVVYPAAADNGDSPLASCLRGVKPTVMSLQIHLSRPLSTLPPGFRTRLIRSA